jgi:hypothetical protein
MSDIDVPDGIDRRPILNCMTWAVHPSEFTDWRVTPTRRLP